MISNHFTDRNGTYQYKYDLPGLSPSANPTSLMFPAGTSGSSKIVYGYDELDRLKLTELDLPSGDWINKHTYHYNDFAQRDQEYRYGSGVNAAAVKLDYTYTDSGELQSATASDVNGATPKARPHQSFGYTYDGGGNLKTRTANPGTKALVTTFTPDTLNQLKTTTRTGRLTVAGATAGNPGSVLVNGVQANLYSDGTFAVEGTALSDTGPTTFNVIAADARGRKDSTSVTVNQPASISFVYDDNGNLRNDGVRTLTYDDLDELSSVEIPGKTRTEFQYDGLRRLRIRKEYTWRLNRWVLASETRYVYDGMLVVEERNGQNVPLVSYTRGADLSKGLQGAGGIGGLLGRTDRTTSKVAYYHSDAGGNVTSLINAQGIQVANYTYDPYGNLVAMTGPLAAANTYRFSSKEWIQSAGLANFGLRFYDPALQRWLTKDTIGEIGGLNLHSYCFNNPHYYIDRDGRFGIPGLIAGGIVGAVSGGISGFTSSYHQGGLAAGLVGAFAGSIGGGLAGGAVGFLGGGIIAGGVGGAVGDIIGQYVTSLVCPSSFSINWGSVAAAGVGGMLGSGFGKLAASQIGRGIGSLATSQQALGAAIGEIATGFPQGELNYIGTELWNRR